MKCPVCAETDLAMSDRQGIEIDYCPKCRGVWLDRGELDKIIERSASERPTPPPPEYPREEKYHHHEPGEGQHRHGGSYYKRRKKGGLLGEIFDF